MAKKERIGFSLSNLLLPYFPDLRTKLKLGGVPYTPREFMDKVIASTFFISLTFTLLTGLIFQLYASDLWWILPIIFILYSVGLFFYFLIYPDAKIIQREKEIDMELVFACRHLLIALRSGMTFFDALVGTTSGYGAVSEELRKIVDKINLGVPVGQALREATHTTPSNAFSRIMIQLANAFSSGSDIADSLEAVLDQIRKEQVIALKEYGQKLNPIIMFFMIFGIIFPSLGVAFAIIFFSLISGGYAGITSTALVLIFLFIGIVQFIFLSIIDSSRPKYII